MATKKKTSASHTLDLDIQFGSESLKNRWEDELETRHLKKLLKSALQSSGIFTVRLVGAAESRKLNRTFRGKDYATNVLTFNYPSTEGDEVVADLVICLPVVVKEAKMQKKAFIDHFSHLLIHGALHAQGFDHEDDIEAEAMESLEIAILNKIGIQNPYQ
jgi:probable rRNA maturation factor